MNLAEIVKANKLLQPDSNKQQFKILVLSNIVVNQIRDFIELKLRLMSIPAEVKFGNYDNIVQDSFEASNYDSVIVFYDSLNLFVNPLNEIYSIDSDEYKSKLKNVTNDILSILTNLNEIPNVIFNSLSSSIYNMEIATENKLDEFIKNVNSFLFENKPINTTIIDLDNIFCEYGWKNLIDLRFFYAFRAPYNVEFYEIYSKKIRSLLAGNAGATKKVLICDCDNTLWGGVIGEDGIDGISLGESSASGKIFLEVHYAIKALISTGVLFCLCSKNNPEDIDKVFEKHDDMILKNSDISIKKVNWKSKSENISEISRELNLGLDSMIFLDDSDYEIDMVNQALPMVKTFKVPQNINHYLDLINSISSYFYTASLTEEDKGRSNLYQSEQLRSEHKVNFKDISEYLSSLDIKVKVRKNNSHNVRRISQLTQKTNQFNLTTKRYTEVEILNFIRANDSEVYSLEVFDKFGEYGLVGVAILKNRKEEKNIDTFLLSCRAIGRNVEYVFLREILKDINKTNNKIITSSYIPTQKNKIVSEFYVNNNFRHTCTKDNVSDYEINLDEYNFNLQDFSYIGVT